MVAHSFDVSSDLGLFISDKRESVCISWELPQALASDSISPVRSIWLTPTSGIRPPEEHTEGYFVPYRHIDF
jgi:hypothetical protein